MIFPGGSTFATDFQQVIDRAVAIAALPLSQLNAQKSVLSSRSVALDGISQKFADLKTALSSVDSAVNSKIYSAAVADETVARATLGSNVLAADYTLEVSSLGSRALTMSLDSLSVVTDPFTETVSASTDFTLTVDGVGYAISSATGSLFDLAAAINESGAGVQATVVNIGGSSPDYRLSIQSESYAAVAIQLNDGSQDLLETLTAGAPVTYTVNGVPAGGISSNTRTVTLSAGLTVDILKAGTTEISVSKTASSLGDALAGFVTAYNSAVSQLDLHRGNGGGILSGQALLGTLARSLSGIIGYSAGAGNIRSLADLGVTVDDQGQLSLDRDVLEAKSISDVVSFLGDSTSGFLMAATDAMTSLQDSSEGLIALEKASLDRQIKRQNELIASNEDRIEAMRQNLTLQIARADGVIAVLEQQVIGIQGLFEAMRQSQKSN
jgi:flagellar hook-associated protein 2